MYLFQSFFINTKKEFEVNAYNLLVFDLLLSFLLFAIQSEDELNELLLHYSRGLLMWSTKWLTNKSKQQRNQVVNYLPAWITARERWSFVTVLIEHFVINVILLTRLNRARLRKSQTVLSMLSMSLHQWNLKNIFFVIFLLISDTISITNANLILLYIYFKC